jgi:CDP-diacylglycerol---glycerol-3-phosphate 3-phosphatidyltransferase
MPAGALLTLPNIVSLSRLLLAAVFVLVPEQRIRVILITVAAATDYLDGWLARRRNSATPWGALIDPIADRMFVFAAVLSYLLDGRLTMGQYFIMLSRDLATAVGFLVARAVSWLRPVAFRARWLGKVVTTLQLGTLIAIEIAPVRVPLFVSLVGVVSAAAIIDYTLTLWRQRAA